MFQGFFRRWRRSGKPRFRQVSAEDLKEGDQFACRRTGQTLFRVLNVFNHQDGIEITIQKCGRCNVGIIVDFFVSSEKVWRKCK